MGRLLKKKQNFKNIGKKVGKMNALSLFDKKSMDWYCERENDTIFYDVILPRWNGEVLLLIVYLANVHGQGSCAWSSSIKKS